MTAVSRLSASGPGPVGLRPATARLPHSGHIDRRRQEWTRSPAAASARRSRAWIRARSQEAIHGLRSYTRDLACQCRSRPRKYETASTRRAKLVRWGWVGSDAPGSSAGNPPAGPPGLPAARASTGRRRRGARTDSEATHVPSRSSAAPRRRTGRAGRRGRDRDRDRSLLHHVEAAARAAAAAAVAAALRR